MDKLIPLDLPPGVFAQGTRYQAKGRWFSSNLVRFFNATIRPIGGWRRLVNLAGTAFPAVAGVPRGLLAWEVDNGSYQIAIGTTETLNLIKDDTLYDITPDGFVIGGESAEGTRAYGSGTYGSGTYGSGAGTTIVRPGMWQLDNFGDVLLALYTGDGELYQFAGDISGPVTVDSETPGTAPDPATQIDTDLFTVAAGEWLLVFVFSAMTDDTPDPTAAEQPSAVTYDPAGSAQSLGAPLASLDFGFPQPPSDPWARAWVYLLQNPQAGASKIVRADWANGQNGAAVWVTRVQNAVGYDIGSIVAVEEQLVPGDPGVDIDVPSRPGDTAVALVWAYPDFGATMTASAGTLQETHHVGGTINSSAFLFTAEGAAPTANIAATFDDSDAKAFVAFAINFRRATAEEITEAPDDNIAVVVTPEHFVMLLGADGDVHKVQWASQATLDDWTPTSENTAGDFILSTHGRLVCGRRGKTETLLWTNIDLWKATYIGGDFIYRFDQAGNNCGAVSAQAPVIVDTKAFWMGQDNFFMYDGFVQTLPCDLHDHVFTNFNRTQRGKVWGMSLAQFGEVWWFYPSGTSDTVDRYVVYNWREGHWTPGTLARSGGIDAGILEKPILADSDGALYQHEYADDRDGNTPFLESGPLEIGDGDRFVNILRVIPDASEIDAVEVKLFASNSPTGTERELGPYSTTQPTNVRAKARQIRVRLQEKVANMSWRIGKFRLGIRPSSRR